MVWSKFRWCEQNFQECDQHLDNVNKIMTVWSRKLMVWTNFLRCDQILMVWWNDISVWTNVHFLEIVWSHRMVWSIHMFFPDAVAQGSVLAETLGPDGGPQTTQYFDRGTGCSSSPKRLKSNRKPQCRVHHKQRQSCLPNGYQKYVPVTRTNSQTISTHQRSTSTYPLPTNHRPAEPPNVQCVPPPRTIISRTRKTKNKRHSHGSPCPPKPREWYAGRPSDKDNVDPWTRPLRQ